MNLNAPQKVVKPTDKIIVDGQFHLARYENAKTAPNNGVVDMIVNEFKYFINDKFYQPNHALFLDNYFDSQKHNRRRPSTFLCYDIIKQKSQTWYNGLVYESYTNTNYLQKITKLEFDELIPYNSTLLKIECDIEECDCCYNYKKYPIFKQTNPLFTRLLSQIKDILVNDAETEYDPILDDMYMTSKWLYISMEHFDLNVFYKITYKNKPYYISYVLIGVYAFIGKFDDDNLNKKMNTTLIDPLLRLLQTCNDVCYNQLKNYKIKTGLYYVEVTEYEPQVKYKNMGIKSNLTYPFYKSKIITDLPIIKIPKIQIGITNNPKRIPLKNYTTKIDAYDNDSDEVVIGHFETTIIYTQPTKISVGLRPTIIPTIKIDDFTKPIILEPPIIIQSQLKPLHIIFNNFVKPTEYHPIRKMLTELYTTNIKFRQHTNLYTKIKIIKGLHTDMNRLDKSLHFNAVFLTDDYESSVFHCYILDDKIASITTITHIL
jgi:hypothetical protein